MIVHRYVAREILLSFAGVTAVLFLIFLSNRFVRFLAEAASGSLPTDVLLTLLLLKSVTSLPVLLPLGLYLGVLIGLGRLYRDSEMTALAACGVGFGSVLRAITRLGIVAALVIAAISLYLAPLAQQKSAAVLQQAEASADFVGIASGHFSEAAGGRLVFYSERVSRDQKNMENVFAQTERDGVTSLLTAQRAQQHVDKQTGDRFLVFTDGYRYEGAPGTANFKMIKFQEHGVLVERRETGVEVQRLSDMETAKLWGRKERKAMSELRWRFAMPISALLLMLIAAVLSHTDPRQGRFSKLFIAIVVYVVYSNLMAMARSWLEQGSVPPAIGLWWVHGILLAAFLFLWAQQSGWTWTWRKLTGKAP